MTREQFVAIRRTFRAAQKLSLLDNPDARLVKTAAASLMRHATGKWDLCEPVRYWTEWATFTRRSKGRHIATPIVTLTAQRFFRRTSGAHHA